MAMKALTGLMPCSTWITLLGLVSIWVGSVSADPMSCVIPKGQFQGQVQSTNIDLPWYGDRCVAGQGYYQVMIQQCVPKYCCSQPCACDSGNDKYDSLCGTNATVISCFELVRMANTTLYACCPGSVKIDHTCINTLNCSVNNGGCSDLCITNSSTGLSSCACSGPSRVALNPFNCTDAPSSTSTSSMPAVTPMVYIDLTPSFSMYYLIAIVVAGILLLLLILIILLALLCVRRRKRRQAAAAAAEVQTAGFVNEKKELPAFDVIKVNKESKVKLEDDDAYAKSKVGSKEDEKVKAVDEFKSFKNGEVQKRAENDYAKIPFNQMGSAARSGSNVAAGRAGAAAGIVKPSHENLYVAGPGVGGEKKAEAEKLAEGQGVNPSDGIYEDLP